MSVINDRRLNGKDKSAVNRKRLLDRHDAVIKRQVTEHIDGTSITGSDTSGSKKIKIAKKDLNEPIFHHGKGGKRRMVHPGNQKKFNAGDLVERPSGGSGGTGEASKDGEGTDEFVFEISQKEFLDYMFEDLALPNMLKKLFSSGDFEYEHAGVARNGRPSQINVVRTLTTSYARRIALTASKKKQLSELKDELASLYEAHTNGTLTIEEEDRWDELASLILKLDLAISRVPWIDDIDVRYDTMEKQPVPSSKAVMFCIMDVSGSMSQEDKDLAKRFFIILYLFLKRNYGTIELVFIRHHTTARECTEEEFFYERDTGGTIVSSALKLTHSILKSGRFPTSEWNHYGAQFSDGDNWKDDSPICKDILEKQLLPIFRHYAYIERPHYNMTQQLWEEYKKLEAAYPEKMGMKLVKDKEDIWPVFRELFKKSGVSV